MAKSTTTSASQKKGSTDTKSGNGIAKNDMSKNTKEDTMKTSSSKYDTAKSGFSKNTGSHSASGTGSKSSSSKRHKTLEQLFEEELKDVYSAEKQLIEALPKMAEAAYSEELQDAFEHHLQQTKRHAERIEKIFDRMGIKKEEKKCFAMEGLIKEGNKIIDEFDESFVRDSALIIGSQKIEHYEIASYGSLCELADVLGYGKVRDLLHRTLEEEMDTDEHLTMISQAVNDEAYEMSRDEEHAEVYSSER
jgi:ferritin-like metal-binding protein YciE